MCLGVRFEPSIIRAPHVQAFLAKSLVAFKLPPKNHTLPLTSRSSNDSPLVLMKRQWTVMEVVPATVVT